jgi:hypothetical protein
MKKNQVSALLEMLPKLIRRYENLWLPPLVIVFILFSAVVVIETGKPTNDDQPFAYRMF